MLKLTCKKCGEKLIRVEHYEWDGISENGSYEPYYECVNNCDIDDELVSNCCGCPMTEDESLCPDCKEGCEAIRIWQKKEQRISDPKGEALNIKNLLLNLLKKNYPNT